MNFSDAAYTILQEAGQPLHYSEVTRRALAKGLVRTSGQTPEATMRGRLNTDTKPPNARFRRVSRGVFALVEPPSSDISQRITTINRQIRTELRKRLLQLSPDRFETLIGELLLALGFEEETIAVTAYGGDGGIDVRGVLNAASITEVNAAVQVKRWKRNVQAPVVQALRGSLTVHEQGIIITTSKFSKGAHQEARASGKVPISLIDGDKLLELLIQHHIGVTAEQHTIYSLDEDWWDDVTAEEIDDTVASESPALPTPKTTYPIPIQATVHGQSYQAELVNQSGQVRYNGTDYRSPSGAGKAVTGWKAVDGWRFWRYQHPETGEWRLIDDLRKQAEGSR